MNEPAAKPGFSTPVLVLSVLLAIAITAAVMAMFRTAGQSMSIGSATADPGPAKPFIPPNGPPGGGTASGSRRTDEPFLQNDVVVPDSHSWGQVYYPIPYATPPNLRLTAKSRKYDIVEQDEFGFLWAARPKLDDYDPKYLEGLAESKTDPQSLLSQTLRAVSGGLLKPNLTFEEFTWEAKGVRGARIQRPMEQSGEFNSLANTEGQVTYPIPYAGPANVSLSGGNYGHPYTTVIESRADGFKWKNVVPEKDISYGTGSVTWRAKGLRARDQE